MMSNRIKYQIQREEKVAAELQLLELNKEEKCLRGGINDNIGRILLRRACEWNCVMLDHIYIDQRYRNRASRNRAI